MQRDTKLVSGWTLITVPTIVYGGLVMLGIVAHGQAGLDPGLSLTPAQSALYRAGHAHAGVLVIFSIVLQLCLEHARFGASWVWAARITAPAAAILMSAGFFGSAHLLVFRFAIYGGACAISFATVVAGVGLIRASAATSKV